MSVFAYRAIPSAASGGGAGAPGRSVTGRLEAATPEALRDRLRSQGLIPVEIRRENALAELAARLRGRALRRADGHWFFQTLHRLTTAGVPIEEAVATVAELSPRPPLRDAAEELRQGLRAGRPFADALADMPRLADTQAVALVRVGMASGRLAHVLALIDESITRRAEIRKQVVGKLTYPVIVLIAAVLAVWFMSSFVVPRFAETLTSAGADLPLSTRVTLALSEHLLIGLPVAAAVIVAILAARPWRRVPGLAHRLDALALRAPVLGPLVWSARAVLIADTIATVIDGGGQVLESLRHAGSAVNSPVLRGRLDAAREAVRGGRDLGEAIADAGVLPPMPAAFVRLGMRSGDLVGSLRWAAKISAEQQERLTRTLLAMLEPATIVLLSGVVGWVVYSLISGMLAVNDIGGL